MQVTPWDPSRPWRGPTAQLGSSAQSSNPLFTQGPLWGPHHLPLGVWGWGQQPAHQLVVRQVNQRLRLIKAFGGKHPLATSGLTCPLRVLPRLGSVHTPTQALLDLSVMAWLLCVFFSHQFGLLSLGYLAMSSPIKPPSVAGGSCQP